MFATDKEKSECLNDVLKGVRITDETAYFASTKTGSSQQLN